MQNMKTCLFGSENHIASTSQKKKPIIKIAKEEKKKPVIKIAKQTTQNLQTGGQVFGQASQDFGYDGNSRKAAADHGNKNVFDRNASYKEEEIDDSDDEMEVPASYNEPEFDLSHGNYRRTDRNQFIVTSEGRSDFQQRL